MPTPSLRGAAFAVLLCFAIGEFVCGSAAGSEPAATPVESITVREGFRVELLRSAQPGEGSWISMTFDDRGRLLIGLDEVGIARLTLHPNPAKIRFQKVEQTLRHCRGVLYAYDSLYVSATNSQGFYRLRDTRGDDRFDRVELLKKLDYRSRFGHGSNQVVLGPDGMLYLVNGNDVAFPEGVAADSPYRDPRGDQLLPNPHDAGQDNRVGHIVRLDPQGKRWEVIAGGLRNQFDLAFNAAGEMFTYDADMEWDVGQPWYRPTRLNHVVSGGEYGWRWGTGKWPTYYEDSLPSTLDTGLGSPTGMVFGTGSRFPQPFRDALFMADWQNGRILLVEMQPSGATYQCRYEVFLEGAPLNVCDLQFGPVGALYFITGGRGSQSGLYRVVAMGDAEAADPPKPGEPQSTPAMQLRRHLEELHVRRDPQSIDRIWPHLSSEDRWLRYAARVALENQAVHLWRERALQETQPTAAIAALVALCRCGTQADREGVLTALLRIEQSDLSQRQLVGLLRAAELCFIRLGPPAESRKEQLAARLGRRYPHTAASVNHLLAELLVYLDDPRVVAKTVELLSAGRTQEEQIRAARTLTHAERGWSLKSRRALLDWLQQARRFRGGKQLGERIGDIRTDFLARLSAQDRAALENEIAKWEEPLAEETSAPARPLVRQWRIDDLLPRLGEVSSGRSFENGMQALHAASCLKCHRLGTAGGQIGPDLSSVGRRFDTRAIVESILLPSKVMDPKYRHSVYLLDNGKTVTGRPAGVSRATISIETDPLTQATVTVERARIEATMPSTVSPMPSGLVDILTASEILDLVAVLKSGGNADDPAFSPSR